MGHVHTNPGEHDHTASAFIVRTDGSDLRVLVHMHKKLGVYLQPGGHIELNETPWQAIEHELEEETGYGIEQMKVMQPAIRQDRLESATVHPIPMNHNTHAFDKSGKHFHSDVSYLMVTDSKPAGTPDDGESNDIIFLNRQQILDLPDRKIFSNVRSLYLFALDLIGSDVSGWVPVDTSIFES